MTSPDFSLLHTTARLPTGWRKAAQHWLDTADCPERMEYILVTDEPLVFEPIFPITRYGVNTERKSNVYGWNKAAQISTGKVLITLADDWFSPLHWDSRLWHVIDYSLKTKPTNRLVIAVDNCDNSLGLIPHAIVTREYYESFGYMFHPDYEGLMSDVEFTEVAYAADAVVDATFLKFPHLNPEEGSTDWDDVYRLHRGPEKLAEGQRIFVKRKSQGFPRTVNAAI